ncbi:hypothetical protein [Micromonospora sp. KC213]|uniref:hypothetical protein n=1 Tax=Micromonospora sp. KC213 TaxID=2530378 RepID=UPI001FB7EACC|nr:hypothetical protein [Micromonospora sp. KC213]
MPPSTRISRIPSPGPKRTATGVVRAAYRFRNALYRLLRDPADEAAFAEVARVAQSAVRATELVHGVRGGAQRRLSDDAGPALPLHAVARAAEDLPSGEAWRSVRACPGLDCGWLFLDVRGSDGGATWRAAATGRRRAPTPHARRLPSE